MSIPMKRRSFLGAAPALGLLGLGGCSDWLARRAGGRSFTDPALERFRAGLVGQVILPDNLEFEVARRPASFNPDTDKRPAIIALCANSEDIIRSLEFADRHGLDIAVRGGGHDVLGRSTCAGGLLIDLGLMNAIDVRSQTATARVETGCRAGHVNAVLQEHDLAVALGCNPGVGVGGLTLGGGLGWLLGRHGAACDNLEAVDLVTVDGRKLRASELENADLFWGLRGGGGNFGIAAAYEFRTHALAQVTGGYIVYRGAQTPQFLRLYRDLMAEASDDLAVEVVIFASPEPPHEPLLIAALCHSGTPSAAERDLARWRRFGPPLAESVRVTPYESLADPTPELGRLLGIAPADRPANQSSEGGGTYNYWRGASLSDWSDAAIDAFVACAGTAPLGWSMGIGHYMHGAVCRVPANATPLVRREGSASYFFNIGWGSPERSEEAMRWVDQSIAALRPYSNEPAYINYLSEESETAVSAAYGSHYARLRELKRKYDPENRLRLNRNISPAL